MRQVSEQWKMLAADPQLQASAGVGVGGVAGALMTTTCCACNLNAVLQVAGEVAECEGEICICVRGSGSLMVTTAQAQPRHCQMAAVARL